MLVQVGSLERLHIREPQSAGSDGDGARQQLAISKQVSLVLPDMIWAKPVW